MDFLGLDHKFRLPPSRFNIAPTQPVSVIRLAGSDRDQSILPDSPLPPKEVALMRWGLIPGWAKEIQTPLFNARSETVADKPSFRGPFRRRRCLIPADGFYEWRRRGASPIPHHICLPENKVFAFAGIWEGWTGPAGEDWLEAASIVTKAAKGPLKKIHSRAPIILTPEDYDLWLRPADPPDRGIFTQLSTTLDEKLQVYEVGPYVNNVRHDGEDCLRPAERDQFSLFGL